MNKTEFIDIQIMHVIANREKSNVVGNNYV